MIILILFFFHLLFLNCVLSHKNIIQINYKINSYSANNDNIQWNSIGAFVLDKNQIYNTSNVYINEKNKLIKKLKEQNFDYVLFQLCYKSVPQNCIQTYIDRKKIQNPENFILLIGLDNNYMPYVLNYRTYDKVNDKNIKVFYDLFAIKVLSVSLPININKIQTDDNINKNKYKGNENGKNKDEPKSFLRKYWIYIAIFLLSLSFSKHLTENTQQTGDS
ncbi:conserved Plasmodium protein, unknown function [Plasmodium berghei]|uniref:ER membrane protein complex subunit 10 n=2 Tax=Plasmodium berghei TaxID=5821 RepID=A0A509AC65_PLABA|nr:conserved Plasmodium protein, unknown function [Plasmodium berghei ANKA]CXH93555.1 conserved Plasmodium protein, unknown function [Plasmodium berghei]SCL90810.1 conserved Plasmodium protein, unknown function [Plasmodium berghei]SCM15359.1 conserved Plasmodium protein, unknown function [Plasmodium berghei]SCM17152.1 conserved Plasmodium protein, unknown function [Plasmodium berghei]SCN22160.1 conserved Plasmodium protein, unknown function [Plasmodium berghei]|eukprot:XP_034419943.1 conserved Plasmodium protein, unknown function [Plasmodium berghei ANKA]